MSEPARDSAGDPAQPKPASQKPAVGKAYKSVLAWLLFLVPAMLGLGGDLWLKSWSFPDGVPADSTLMPFAGRHPGVLPVTHLAQAPVPVIPGVLGFTTTVNQGAVFGIAQGKVDWFLGFSVLALGFIVWMFATSRADQRVVHLALGLITAGALGNLYDRAVYHGVRDMLKFYVNWFPFIFNVADALLDIGVPLLIARWLFVKEEPNP
jgi:signal peptidase II